MAERPPHPRISDLGHPPHHRLHMVFISHRDALLRFLTRRVGDHATAEDLSQDTWLRMAGADAAAVSNPRAYLFRIAANLATDHRRRRGREIEHPADAAQLAAMADPQPSPETVVMDRDRLARLLVVVDRLPPRCRAVFLLARVDGLTHGEIASRLGISRNTVVSHMVKALAALDAALITEPPSDRKPDAG